MKTKSLEFVTSGTRGAWEIWNHHSSYQWTYFPEEAKQLIQFFLADRIHGRNLDIGSGWYSYHPNSTALDLSPKGLEYNLSKEKVLFDLESIGRGQPLPFSDKSFNSATLVSVWQYLRHRKLLLKELERILVPGSEVFIINKRGAGWEDLIVGPTDPERIEQEIAKVGYDCFREVIPFRDPTNPFQSVTVAMPAADSFGRQQFLESALRRTEESKKRIQNSDKFYNAFALWETTRAEHAFQNLGTYPITQYSQDYQQRLQAFGDSLESKTGKIPLIFMDHDILPSLHLTTPNKHPSITFTTLSKVRENLLCHDEEIRTLFNEYRLNLSQFIGYKGISSLEELDHKLNRISKKPEWEEEINIWESGVRDFVDFLASIPLTKQTIALQGRIYDGLSPHVIDLDNLIQEKKMQNVCLAGQEEKQRRSIDELVSRKEEILARGVPIAGEASFDYGKAMSYYRVHVRERVGGSFIYSPRL